MNYLKHLLLISHPLSTTEALLHHSRASSVRPWGWLRAHPSQPCCFEPVNEAFVAASPLPASMTSLLLRPPCSVASPSSSGEVLAFLSAPPTAPSTSAPGLTPQFLSPPNIFFLNRAADLRTSATTSCQMGPRSKSLVLVPLQGGR